MSFPKAYEGNEPYIFVSYAHGDSQQVLLIISALQDRGFRIWYDAGIELGTEWPEYIAQHLNDCSCFVAFMSRHAAESHNCRREINFAIKLRKEPLVIYLDEAELSLGMQMQLDSLQALYRTRHNDDNSFLTELCRSRLLSPCREEPSQQTPAQPTQYSQDELYRFWMRGIRAQKLNPSDAERCVRIAAEAGYSPAQGTLGNFYLKGIGVPKDAVEAVKWLRKAGEKGNFFAQRILGQCYARGEGVEQSYTEARKWIEKAAQQRDELAQELLLTFDTDPKILFRLGEEARERSEVNTAITYYFKAADLGSAEAQLMLGECYSVGAGHLPKDREIAVEWYRKAARQGHPDAEMVLKRLGRDW